MNMNEKNVCEFLFEPSSFAHSANFSGPVEHLWMFLPTTDEKVLRRCLVIESPFLAASPESLAQFDLLSPTLCD